MKRGKFIVFEGVSGTGKETQAKLLQTYLTKKGIKSIVVFHPSPNIKKILRAAKSVTDQIHILAHDRAGVASHIIKPALARGEWVISLRNYVSAYVYQGNGIAVKRVEVTPDYLFYFDIDPEVSMKRIFSRGETLGKYETPKLLQEKRKKYRSVLRTIPHITIDAGKSIDEIHREVVKYIV